MLVERFGGQTAPSLRLIMYGFPKLNLDSELGLRPYIERSHDAQEKFQECWAVC